MPFVKPMDTVDLLFEPVAAVTVVTNLDQGDIPNEDSQDTQLDISNLFEKNRFNGFDRVEDLSRVTYGVRTGLDWHDGSVAELFLGQSYRFEDDESPFAENSGLEDQQSDFVGRLKVGYRDLYTLDYGFQLDNEQMQSVRHEVDQLINLYPVTLRTRYLYAQEIAGVTENREQIQGYATYNFTPEWRALAGVNYDFGDDPGLRKSLFGFDYLGQCLTFSAVAQRNLTEDSTGESSTELLLRLGLKNLGEFQSSGISLGSSGGDDDDDNVKGIPD
jgi:LPS-assembly protein